MSQSDRDLIQNHLARHCFAVDRARSRLAFNGTFHGREAIQQCYAEWIRTKREPVAGLRHLIYVPLITLDGDEATAETYVDADAHTRRSGRSVLLRSLSRDRLSRGNGEWRFAERENVPMRSLYDKTP